MPPTVTSESSRIEALYKRVAQGALENQWAEHRSVFRLPFNCEASIGRLDNGIFSPLQTAYAVDLSIDGIGLLAETDFTDRPGLHLQISIEGEPYCLPIRIVSSRRLFGQIHRLGALFVDSRQDPAA